MKLTLQNIKKLKQETNSSLTKKVCNYVINKWSDYSNKTDIFTDVLYHGCQSGIVGELIYYKDTLAFYNRFKNEINNLLYETMQNCGIYNPSELFREKWDKEDPLSNDYTNQNLLAWFGFEETLRNIAYNFEALHNYI